MKEYEFSFDDVNTKSIALCRTVWILKPQIKANLRIQGIIDNSKLHWSV